VSDESRTELGTVTHGRARRHVSSAKLSSVLGFLEFSSWQLKGPSFTDDNGTGEHSMEKLALQREDVTPHWSRGELVKVRSKTAENWRDAYVLTQRGRNLLLVIPEGMIYPDGRQRTRLSLVAEDEPGVYHRPLDGADFEVMPGNSGNIGH
jgi:hypothetical protein